MPRQHHFRTVTRCVKPFIIFGSLSASLLFTTNTILASDTSTASVAEVSSGSATENRLSALFSDVRQYLGIRYRFGGTTPAGFDCSGFVRFMFSKVFNMQLPRSSREMSIIGTKVDRDDLRPGDLVFFQNARNRINHVGIFIGNGMFIHSSLSKGITRDQLNESYYDKRFATGVRVMEFSEPLLQQDLEKLTQDTQDNGEAS